MDDDPGPMPSLPIEAYRSAIEEFKACRRELSECELEIEVARIQKDTTDLRHALSRKNRLIEHVQDARARIRNAAVEVIRFNGMQPVELEPRKKEGIIHKAVDIVSKLIKT